MEAETGSGRSRGQRRTTRDFGDSGEASKDQGEGSWGQRCFVYNAGALLFSFVIKCCFTFFSKFVLFFVGK